MAMFTSLFQNHLTLRTTNTLIKNALYPKQWSKNINSRQGQFTSLTKIHLQREDLSVQKMNGFGAGVTHIFTILCVFWVLKSSWKPVQSQHTEFSRT